MWKKNDKTQRKKLQIQNEQGQHKIFHIPWFTDLYLLGFRFLSVLFVLNLSSIALYFLREKLEEKN